MTVSVVVVDEVTAATEDDDVTVDVTVELGEQSWPETNPLPANTGRMIAARYLEGAMMRCQVCKAKASEIDLRKHVQRSCSEDIILLCRCIPSVSRRLGRQNRLHVENIASCCNFVSRGMCNLNNFRTPFFRLFQKPFARISTRIKIANRRGILGNDRRLQASIQREFFGIS